MIAVTILGNNSASPAHGRHPTSQVIQTDEHFFLVDCGEGTLFQMNKYKIRQSRINHIFISHLHGDHYFGLIGLINTYALNHRQEDLHIYSPSYLREINELQMKAADAHLTYKVHYHVLSEEGILFEDNKISVSTFKVHHQIPCFGFLFRELKNKRKLNFPVVKKYNVPKAYYDRLHNGEDFIAADGSVVANDVLTLPHAKGKSYAFCADTLYMEEICSKIQGVDMVYHESTYLQEQIDRAAKRFHSTAIQAATIAKIAGAKKLLLGHYSSMYDDIEVFGEEARTVFKNTEASREGVSYIVR